ncbi:hypothetical protein AVEN_249267-1 [Araneus ventricosus]|uniref:Uncharacterized protein n=1 Tax=Araneus ventricosus TaxID=182803 RepID=A0A4Y2KC78_ARAVE|nr:hypothetical protein AVEN_249267-1 [Araneus ventricosus]
MYRSFQNETNPLLKLWIRISDSESESVIPIPRIRQIRSLCSELDPVIPFEDSDPWIRFGVNDLSLRGLFWYPRWGGRRHFFRTLTTRKVTSPNPTGGTRIDP